MAGRRLRHRATVKWRPLRICSTREGAPLPRRQAESSSQNSEVSFGLYQKLNVTDVVGRLKREGEVDVHDVAET